MIDMETLNCQKNVCMVINSPVPSKDMQSYRSPEDTHSAESNVKSIF